MTTSGGCSGRLTCQFISTTTSRIGIEPTDAKVVRLECSQCYWWVDDEGLLNIAGKFEARSLFGGKFDRALYISFVPGVPSQGVGRDYKVNRNTVRAFVKYPPSMLRLKSTYGIMGVEHRDSGGLVGAFRANMLMQQASYLGGWGKSSPYLVFGTFSAVEDRVKGMSIRSKSEEEGFDRSSARAIKRRETFTSSRPVIK